jgi:hypothetical protein
VHREHKALDRRRAALELADVSELLKMLKKIRKLDWEDIGKTAPNGTAVKSIRINQKARLLAYRDGNTMGFLSLHFDHDSAYR